MHHIMMSKTFMTYPICDMMWNIFYICYNMGKIGGSCAK